MDRHRVFIIECKVWYFQDDAQKGYIQLVNELVAAEGGSSPAAESTASSDNFKDIVVTKTNNICTIRLNRPRKKNALTREVWILTLIPTGS